MSVSTPPSCAYGCVYDAGLASNCLDNYTCLCKDQTYLDAAISCIQSLCDATDQTLWIEYGDQNCAAVGVSVNLSTTSNPTEQATATPATTSASSSPSSSSDSGSGSGGLSVGDKATIAGSVLGGITVILAILTIILDKLGKLREFIACCCCCRLPRKHNPRAELEHQEHPGVQSYPNTQPYRNQQAHPMSYVR